MIETEKILPVSLSLIHHFPFDVLKMTGDEAIDFLQRISTNDFKDFTEGKIQKTLLLTDKGRILDTIWVIHRNNHLIILTSKQMSSEIISFVNNYIIMEDIVVTDVTSQYSIDLHFGYLDNFYHTDYFGFPVSFDVQLSNDVTKSVDHHSREAFEQWRIEHGIPVAKKEILQDYNPLELNLWDWISFTKGCYIGQEVIARIDTYNKIQRQLCLVSSNEQLTEREVLVDDSGAEIGKLTSVINIASGFIGLAIVKMKYAVEQQQVNVKGTKTVVKIERVFTKEAYGRN
ncbi:MAG: hypothetical protein WDA22_06390 [Bacteroidota bacterium]